MACASGPVAPPRPAPELIGAVAPTLPDPQRDDDADGFVGPADTCPGEPGVGPMGCPLRDSDADGFVDEADRCGDDPGVAPDGCPPDDDDGDLVIDARDPCPTAPETVNGFQDRDGCPDEIPRDLAKFEGVVKGIEFALDRDVLRRSSGLVLRRVAAVLARYPEVRIEISVHTSSTGSREYNLDLSRRRAEAVKRDLVGHGVAADRIETRGAGPDEPWPCNICPPDAHKKDRRIEFRIVEGPRFETPRAGPMRVP
jgi:outer membrane protein OmpA-like peptidoglycan-associated protein